MAKYLDPKSDLTFKRVFADPKRKHLCISLINNMLPLEVPVADIDFQSGEILPALPEVLRNSIVDVRCTDKTGRQFIVEMQLYWDKTFMSRVLFNAAKLYVIQLERGEKIRELEPVYALNFVNKEFDKSFAVDGEYYHYYSMSNVAHRNKQIEGMGIVFVELPKFKPQNRVDRKLHELWLRFLTEIDENTKEIPEELLQDELISEAVDFMRTSAYTKEELDAYYTWKMNCMTAEKMVENAEARGEARGEQIGLQRGEQIGLQKGEQIGLQKGIINIALNAIKRGMPDIEISELTGLTLTEIQELKVKNKIE